MTDEKFQEIILEQLKNLSSGQEELKKGQINLSDRLTSFETQTNNRLNKIDDRLSNIENKVDVLYDKMGEVIEFKIEAEPKLKKIL